MRLDRLLTLRVSRPLRGKSDDALRPRLPILMYHSISDDPESGVHPYFKVCTSPQRFAEQMQWLADGGWRGVTLSEGLAALGAQGQEARDKGKAKNIRNKSSVGSVPAACPVPPAPGSPSAKLVVITFDDGFRDFHTAAVPAMQRHGFSSTMYLPTAFISDQRKSFKSRECLTWNEVIELQRCGTEFGSHTVNHPRLIQLHWPEIESELRDSRTELEQRLGRDISAFAYPYAFPQAETEFATKFCALLQQAGYASNVTTTIERAASTSDQLRLPRLPANSDDDRRLFEAKLDGAYDWMSTPQAVTKTISRWIRPGSRPVTVR